MSGSGLPDTVNGSMETIAQARRSVSRVSVQRSYEPDLPFLKASRMRNGIVQIIIANGFTRKIGLALPSAVPRKLHH